jgi:hypothetical protein
MKIFKVFSIQPERCHSDYLETICHIKLKSEKFGFSKPNPKKKQKKVAFFKFFYQKKKKNLAILLKLSIN